MTASGRRQQSDESTAPAHAANPAPAEPSFIASSLAQVRTTDHAPYAFLRVLCSERAVLERQPVWPTAALDQVSGLRGLGQHDGLFAGWARDLIRDCRRPFPLGFPQPEGMPGSIWAVDEVASARTGRDRERLATVRTANGRHQPPESGPRVPPPSDCPSGPRSPELRPCLAYARTQPSRCRRASAPAGRPSSPPS